MTGITPNHQATHNNSKRGLVRLVSSPFIWILLLALGVRIFACINTHILNPDGIHYLHQARAIFFGSWHDLTGCRLTFVSLLPFLIAAVYPLVDDWIVAGQAVNVLFSVASLIPLYAVCKRFFDTTTARTSILVFAMIPAFVGRSADIVRGPVFWFFLAMGLFLFVKHWDRGKSLLAALHLPLSCLFFLLSVWMRIEGVIFVLVSALYLILSEKEHRLRALALFLSPVIFFIGVGLVLSLAVDNPAAKTFRPQKIVHELTAVAHRYETVREALKTQTDRQPGHIADFFKQVEDAVWIVPLAALINCALEKFFYPYVLIFLLGFKAIREWTQKKPAGYFLYLVAAATIVLYLHLINTWLIYDRFLVILILPGVLLVAAGCKVIMDWLQSRYGLKKQTALLILIVFILVFGLGKNLRPRYEEKDIFVTMGNQIAAKTQDQEVHRIAAAPSNAYEWVFFYANRNFRGAPCSKKLIGRIENSYPRFLDYLRTEKIRFVLWSQRKWPHETFDLMASPYENDFETLGQWDYHGSDRFVLLQLKPLK